MTSSSRPEQWIVPGGGIEPEEEPSATAVREVVEEAGVVGRLHRRLGTFEDRVSTCDLFENYYIKLLVKIFIIISCFLLDPY